MTDLIKPISSIFFLNTKLFTNCIEGVTEDIYLRRESSGINNIAFIACHIIDARFFIARFAGAEIENPFKDVFDRIKSPGQAELFPPVGTITPLWKEISIHIENRFKEIPQEYLMKEAGLQLPLTEKTILGGLSFLIQHEAFHIGQLALLRKLSGLSAMKYV